MSKSHRGQYKTYIKDINKSEADNVYVNVEISHTPPNYISSGNVNGPTYYLTNTNPETSEYNVSKNVYILEKASNYFASIIRFSIPLDELPLMVCKIVPNQSNPNLTPYSIGIKYNNIYKSENLIYLPNNNPFTPVPVQNDPTKQVITSYYYIYLYQIFINMLNIALKNVYVAQGLDVALAGYMIPYFYLDQKTDLLNLIVPKQFTQLILADIPQIYISRSLLSLLDNFNLFQVGDQSPIGYDFAFNLSQSVGGYTYYPQSHLAYYPPGVTLPATTTPGPALPLYYKFVQEFGTLQYWSSLSKIIIASNMPIKNEFLPAGSIGSVNINQSGSNVTFPILTDFIPAVDNKSGNTRSIAYYVPPGQYRLVDLISDTPLRNIDIRVFWQDTDGNTYPLSLPVYESMSIKIAFINKSLYKGDTLLTE